MQPELLDAPDIVPHHAWVAGASEPWNLECTALKDVSLQWTDAMSRVSASFRQ